MDLLAEFNKQMTKFRDLTSPYSNTYGSVVYDQALLLPPAEGQTKSLYGARKNKQDPEYLQKLAAI